MKKVFISYSHKDEEFRSALDEQLTMLKRNGVVSIWHDRKIIAGQEWGGEIDSNLNEADIVIFLISSSFLASDYCYDIEAKQAMENYSNDKCQIISIIVRHCDWTDCVFSKYQVLPTGAKPVSSWTDEDEAWLDTVNGIKEHIKEFQPVRLVSNPVLEVGSFTEKWLDDIEISFSHRRVSSVLLSHVFVTPDLEYQATDKNLNVKIKNSSTLLSKNESFLISGEDQQGKTSLLKYLYRELLKDNKLPLYLDASKIKKSSLKDAFSGAVSRQYIGLTTDDFLKNKDHVLLIDDIDRISLNSKYRAVFLNNVNQMFEQTFITCHSTFAYVHNEIDALNDYQVVTVLGLGHKKREELTKKWLSLGQEESISESKLYSQCDEITARLNLIIKRNIVPAKPIYVLMLLQMFEANSQLNTELTSYGHCYQQLIYQAFEAANIPAVDFEKYLNVMSELSWWILSHGKAPNSHELKEFFKTYSNKFLDVDGNEVVKKLVKNSILNSTETTTEFKYPYIYYFFAGKKIAESYRDSEVVRQKVSEILTLLHREDYANILIFITHHTKDLWVLSEIEKVLSELFIEQNPASLNKTQLAFMENFMKEIPELIIEQREIQNERDAHNERLDEMERIHPPKEEQESSELLVNINKTFKGMEIAGQIIRNRHASLTKDSMVALANSGISSGLRLLEYFIVFSDTAKTEIINLITSHHLEQPMLSNRDIERLAESAYLELTYGLIHGVLNKIASSVGSKEALSIYNRYEEESGTAASSLIRLSIELQFNKSLNLTNVADCKEKLKGNSVCTRILKEMVVRHIYMFPVEYKEKQKLSNLLGISVQGQRLMDQREAGKG